MTCIVGIVDKVTDNVIIGADSAGVDECLNIRSHIDVKVFRNGEFVIGCTTSFRMIQLLRFSFKPPSVGDLDIYEYMCTTFITEVRKCFKEAGYIKITDMHDERGGTFLVAYKNRLFKIFDDFQVSESRDRIEAAGCGESYALGALIALGDVPMSAQSKLQIALETAAYLSAGVRAPFIIEST